MRTFPVNSFRNQIKPVFYKRNKIITFLYNNPVRPFILQSFMTKYTGWVFHQPFNFYFINLLRENILILFSILGIFLIIKKYKFEKLALIVIILIAFIPYNLVAHKEMRLLIPILPLLYILTSYGVMNFCSMFKKNKNLILAFLLIVFLFFNVPKLNFDNYDVNFKLFYDYINSNKIENGLWISNPAMIAHSNLKASELIYFPLYNSEKIDYLIENIDNANHILINTCDILPCPPYDDSCNEKSNDFISFIKNRFDLVSETIDGKCSHYIFKSVN